MDCASTAGTAPLQPVAGERFDDFQSAFVSGGTASAQDHAWRSVEGANLAELPRTKVWWLPIYCRRPMACRASFVGS
jgi:hypothetical protein